MLRRSTKKRLYGFLSYTLSRSRRRSGRLEGPSAFDRTHVLNFALGYRLGRGWQAGTRASLYSGIPAEVAYRNVARHPPRGPLYWRLDWRLEKRWKLSETGFVGLILEVLNTTLNKETLEVSCYALWLQAKTPLAP